MTHPLRPSRLELALLVLIVLLAGALRLGAPGISEFKLDEAHLSRLALDTARGKDFPLLGIGSSVGIPNMPVSVWLFAIPYIFSANPILATLFVGLLNLVAVGLTWWFARRYFGPVAALIAALLYAVSPWAVIYSRKIWAQDLLPPFVLLTVITGTLGLLEGNRPHRWRWQVAHLVLLIITVQIHYAALVLVLLSFVMLWLARPTISRRAWLILGGIALLGLIIVIGAALVLSARGVDLNVFGRDGLGLTSDALYHFMITIIGRDIHSLAGPQAFEDFLVSVPDYSLLQTLLAGLVVLAALWALVTGLRHVPGSKQRVRLMLVAWLVIPVAVFSITWTPTFPHYLIPLMPAAFILAGAGLTAAWQAVQSHRPALARATASVGIILLVSLAAFQVWHMATLLDFVDNHATPGGFGTPLHHLLDVRDAVLAQAPADVLITGLSDKPAIDQEAAVWTFLLYDVPSVRPLSAHLTVVHPAEGSRVLVLDTPALNPDNPALPSQLNLCDAPAESFALRPGENVYSLCEILAPETGLLSDESLVAFANGAHLQQVTWIETADNQATIVLIFTTHGPLPVDYHVFNHVLDASGERIAQQDGPLWGGRYWREGEAIEQRFTLTTDVDLSQAETLRIGLYILADGQPFNVDVLDSAGTPAGQWVDIPLAAIRVPSPD